MKEIKFWICKRLNFRFEPHQQSRLPQTFADRKPINVFKVLKMFEIFQTKL